MWLQKFAALTGFGRRQNAKRRHPVTRMPHFEVGKSGILAGWRFTAR
jgi:hypothetical protein